MLKQDIFALEIDGEYYHLSCCSQDEPLHKDSVVLRSDVDHSEIYFCEECGEQII